MLALIFVPIFIFGVNALGEFLPLEERESLFSIVSLAAVILTVLFAIPQVFKHLFSARDVEFLFTLPISTKHIFWVKYIQSFFSTAGFVWLLLSFFLVVFGAGADALWVYFLFIPLVALAVVLIGLTFAYLFNLLLIQILPRNRAKELMTLMTGLAGFFIFIIVQLPNLLGITGTDVRDEFSMSLPVMPTWLPTTWAGEAMAIFSVEFSVIGIVWVMALVALAILVAILTPMIVERGFRTGWIRLNEGSSRGKKRKQKLVKGKLLKHPVVFLGLKELRAVQRDPREWLTFLPMLFLMIFPFFGIVTNAEAREAVLDNPLISWLVAHAMIIFFFTLLIGTFTASSIGREERAVWILRIMPLSGMQIALGKLWIHWLIPYVFVIFLEVILMVVLGWAWYWTLAGAISFGFISLGMASIGLWAGTIGGKYNPNNPQQRIETGTGFLLVLINIPYIVLMFSIAVLVFMPTEFQPFVADFGENSFGILAMLGSLMASILSGKILLGSWSIVVGLLILVLASLAVTYLFLMLSAERIDQGIQINIVENTSGSIKRLN
ncbi:MAG: hypothetical protein LRY73_11105 [Bacillus sp. (in: Bacteria)]|nr:hypothetical protein [Bacillus sp. (in: firmicutes)]